MSIGASSRTFVLGCILSVSAIAPVAAQPPIPGVVKAPVAMSVIAVAERVDCFTQQGNCESQCSRSGGYLNACFQQCQEEKDRCDAEQH